MDKNEKKQENNENNLEAESDDEIPCYQVPRNDHDCHGPCSPTTPTVNLLMMPSSLTSSTSAKVEATTKNINMAHDATSFVAKNENPSTFSAVAHLPNYVYGSLGMSDKDISWASSMESSAVEGSPRKDFNTIEKATFFPDPDLCHVSQIQPRALFPVSSSESLGLKPLEDGFDSEDLKPYTTEMRLSDVCDVLRTLNVVSTASSATPSSRLSENPYDLDIQNAIPNSPSLFSPALSNKSASQPDRNLQSLAPCGILLEGDGVTSPKASTTSTRSQSFDDRPLHCSSPSVFSPENKQSSQGEQIKVCALSPIPELNSREESALEISLDVTNPPNSYSTPVKNRQVMIHKNTTSLHSTIEENDLISGCVSKKKASAAKCLDYSSVKNSSKVLEDDKLDTGAEKNLNSSALFKDLLVIVDISHETPRNKLNISSGKKSKVLYGSTTNLKPLDTEMDEILKSVMECENVSSKFFNDNQKPIKTFPKTSELMSLNTYLKSENIIPQPPIRDAMEMPNGNRQLDPGGVSFSTAILIPSQLATKRPRLEASPWTSKEKYLIDSQADVTDTEIYQAMEEIETSIATGEKSETSPTYIKPKRKKTLTSYHLRKKKKKPSSEEMGECNRLETTREGSEKAIDYLEKNDIASGKDFYKVDEQTMNTIHNEESLLVTDKSFVGFLTGNNKILKPSEASVCRVRRILGDCQDLYASETKIVTGHQVDPGEKEVKLGFLGFRTGNEKIVQPSETSVAKVKKIFEDVDFEKGKSVDKEDNIVNCENFSILKQANNYNVTHSKTSLEFKSETNNTDKLAEVCLVTTADSQDIPIMREIKSSDKADEGSSWRFEGFKTGNNKIIHPSKTSLEKVRSLLDCTALEEDTLQLQDLRTGTAPSADSLAEAIKLPDDSQAKTHPPFIGFTTGTSKSIMPSEASLARVRNLFSDCCEGNPLNENYGGDMSAKPVFKSLEKGLIFGDKQPAIGFLTGNKVTVMPSEESLRKAKALFEDNDARAKSDNKCLTSLPDPTDPNLIIQKNYLETDLEIDDAINIGNEHKFQKNLQSTNYAKQETDEESYLALLANTDWDDPIMPSGQPLKLKKEKQQVVEEANLVVQPATKRPRSLIEDLACVKKQRTFETEITATSSVRRMRDHARKEQSCLGGKEKGKVCPQSGLYLRNKELGTRLSWREALPKGPECLDRETLLALDIPDFVLDITSDNAQNFRFSGQHFFSDSAYETNTTGLVVGDGFLLILDDLHCAGAEEVERAFLAGPGVAPQLVPPGWIRHHYGLLVWKLASYERSCPRQLAGAALTPHNLMLQLKYRYDREIDRSERSAIKKILERDEPAGKAIVLIVMRITKLAEGYELLLTDGWYTCPARVDSALARAVQCAKLRVGTKLMTQGAELIGCEQGIPPLEMPSGVYLKISSNATRRVRWFHKMGFQRFRCVPALPLTSILPGGGTISHLRVVVVKIYPLVYVEKNADGRNVTRNARAEEKAALVFQGEQEKRLEQLYSQYQEEITSVRKRKTRKHVGVLSLNSVTSVVNAEELCNMLENAQDPATLESLLTNDQKAALSDYQEKCRYQAGRDIQKKIEKTNFPQRNVRSVLRVRVSDLVKPGQYSALLSWWQPGEELISMLEEGKALALFHVTPGNSKSQLYLNSTRQTLVEPLSVPIESIYKRRVALISDITLAFQPIHGEFDVVGLVVLIHQIRENSDMQTVYLTETGDSFFGLVFWRGLQEFCYEEILAEGLVVSACNVHWRRASYRGAIPCGYVTETTLITRNSKSAEVQAALDNLKQELEEVDVPTLIEKCQDKIISLLHAVQNPPNNSANSSALSMDNSINTSVESPGDSSLHPRPQYLNGFAQRPRAASTPVKSRTPVQWRLDKLQQVGQPPPLSPMPLLSANNARPWSRPFRLPAATESPSIDI